MQETVLFLCAHNDDQLLGAGGTIAKWSKEGKKIVTIIFSFGEQSHPLQQDIVTRKTRVKESKKAAKVLGEEELYYIGLKETRFSKEIEERNIHEKLANMIQRIKPQKIFTHSMDDPHPDHRAVYRFTLELIDEIKYGGEVYSFNIWNFFLNFRRRDLPKLVVDITDTFKKKVEAFRIHKSQGMTILVHMWHVYFQAIMHGFDSHVKYAEVFYKIK
jgi:N-acetylglucosamine malate deacetylase 1